MVDLDKEKENVLAYLERMGYLKDQKIKNAMFKVNREDFVLPGYKVSAYIDTPLVIPGGQTISALHMHAIFMSAAKLKPGDKVLEVGAGSGILLAYMREVVGKTGKVVGIEIVPETYEFAKKNLRNAGYKDIKLILGDGSKGVPDEAPFDKIIVSATCPEIPKPLIDQLKVDGILIAPVGGISGNQELIYLEKTKEGIVKKNLGGVVFVPLTGKYGYRV
jgi:protein-L-isoaspartate(D-aspartate) O-methyltransferase